ncbi:MAG: hypothetical protein ACT4PQ_06610 [Betaproteobacteria bacterium]
MFHVNERSLDGAQPSLSTSVNALSDEDMAFSGTAADNTTDFCSSLMGHAPMGCAFTAHGIRSFVPIGPFDSLYSGDSHIVSFDYVAIDDAITRFHAARTGLRYPSCAGNA